MSEASRRRTSAPSHMLPQVGLRSASLHTLLAIKDCPHFSTFNFFCLHEGYQYHNF